MSRAGVSFEEVVEAAESLINKGENPTIEKVRLALGSRGSNSTISKHLGDWRSNIAASSATTNFNNNVSVDSNILKRATPDPVNRAVKVVWEQIQAEKQQEIESIKAETAAKIDNLIASNQELEHNLEDIISKSEELNSINKELQQELTECKNELQQERELNIINTNKIAELNKSKEEFTELSNKMLDEIKLSYKNNIENIEKQSIKQVNILTAEIEDCKTRAEHARHEFIVALDNERTSNNKLKSYLEVLENNNKDLANKILSIELELKNAKNKYESTITSLQRENISLKQENIKFTDLLTSINQQVDSLGDKLDKTFTSSISDNIDLLAEKINLIADNFNAIYKQKILQTRAEQTLQNNTKATNNNNSED